MNKRFITWATRNYTAENRSHIQCNRSELFERRKYQSMLRRTKWHKCPLSLSVISSPSCVKSPDAPACRTLLQMLKPGAQPCLKIGGVEPTPFLPFLFFLSFPFPGASPHKVGQKMYTAALRTPRWILAELGRQRTNEQTN